MMGMDDYWFRVSGPGLRPGGRPDLTRLLPNLVVGEYPVPADAEWLRDEHGITAVLSLQDDGDLASKDLDIAHLERTYHAHRLEFRRVAIPDGDMAAFAERLDAAVTALSQFLDRGKCVYLHCNAGMNRAPTVAIAYLHVHGALPLHRARDFVKQQRACVPYMHLLESRFLP